jgi:hypothetical protein
MLTFAQTEPNIRVMEVGKNKLFMKREDPYGFVYINFERGELPEMLKGAYTSFTEAEKKVSLYLKNKGKADDSA